ncbi:hypothetical protein M9H77_17061 [Catharanthus roseus]|uniref:Uncharacterized protein n=1 Tax=Catharanthus roseus TaxID=4058 RepID=A0ACC0B3X3_CATRO|nr:hypothetical protein M9H77_17061 [Catharanthus roseus]
MYDECKKVTKRNKDLKSKTQFLLDENSRLICENKAILESLEVLKKEKECSNDDFQKLVLENKNLCARISFLEKCLIDYDVLKKKVNNTLSNQPLYTQAMEEHAMEEEEYEEKQENDQEAQNLPQDVIYPKGHSKDEIIGDVSQGVRTRRNFIDNFALLSQIEPKNLAEETKIRSSGFRTGRPIFPKSKIRQFVFQRNKSESFCPKIRSSGFRTGRPISL